MTGFIFLAQEIMSKNIKSGKDIIDDFFEDIKNLEGIDPDIVTMLTGLHSENKLTKGKIEEKLEKMRNSEKRS